MIPEYPSNNYPFCDELCSGPFYVIYCMSIEETGLQSNDNSSNDDIHNYGAALRQLKLTEELIRQRQKQKRVNAMRAQRGSWFEQQRKHRELMQQQAKEERIRVATQVQALKKQERQRVQELRQKGEQLRKEGLLNRSQKRLQLMENRVRMTKQVKEKSQEYSQRISSLRQKLLKQKRQNHNELYTLQQDRKSSYQEFQRSRVSGLQSIQDHERDQIIEILKSRESQLRRLQRDQSEPTTLPASLGDSRISRGSRVVSGQRSRAHPLHSRVRVPSYEGGSGHKKKRERREKSTTQSLIQCGQGRHSIFL